MRYLMVLLLSITAFAQQSDVNYTGQMLNGRGWNSFLEPQRVTYVLALRDSILYEFNATLNVEEAKRKFNRDWATGFVTGDYVDELDKLYKAGENARIPVTMAFRYCTFKFQGTHTTKEVEEFLIALRSLVAEMK